MNRHDPALAFFGACGVLTLAVSLPATFALLRPFHDTGDWLGVALAVFATAVFEIGAVGAKLITLAVPQWNKRLTALTVVLLVLTTVGNWLSGVELFRAATLPPTLAEWRGAGAGPYLAGVAAALFPALLFVWLTAFTARVKQIARQVDTPVVEVAPAIDTPRPLSTIAYLKDVEGLSFAEIGKRLNISRQAAQQRYKKEAA